MNGTAVESRVVEYGGTSVVLASYGARAAAVVERVCGFFATHATIGKDAGGRAPFRVLEIGDWADLPQDWARAATDPVVIRESSARDFNLSGLRGRVEERDVVVCAATGTAFGFAPGNATAQLYASDSSFIQLVELVRDLVIKNEEAAGRLLLHASAAAVDGSVVAAVGPKGAGKSTFLLDLVARHGFGYTSGDKLFLDVRDGVLTGQGWPDFPHLGIGTILGHPSLAGALRADGYDVEPAQAHRKLLLDPAVLESAFGLRYQPGPLPLSAVVLPHVGDAADGRLEPAGVERLGEILGQLEYSQDNAWMQWHSFAASPSRAALEPARAAIVEELGRVPLWSASGRAPYPGVDRLAGGDAR